MKNKNYNIELIRIIAMIMILTLHCNLFSAKVVWSLDTKNMFFTIMEFISIVAVNLYVLISGFFLINSKFSLKKIINLEIIVVFYSVIIYLLLMMNGYINWNIRDFSRMFFPIINSNYWFYTCYVVLYILMPIIKKIYILLKESSKEKITIIILVIITSILPSINPVNNQLNLDSGYNYMWFITLVFLGAYIRENEFKIKTYKLLLMFIMVLIFQLIIYYNIKKITALSLFGYWHSFLYSYNNTLVLINSLLLFILINKIRIKKNYTKKIIGFFSASTFSVYLIHIHPFMIGPILQNKLDISKYLGTFKIFQMYFFVIIALFLICIFIDKIRICLFNIINKIPFMKYISKKIDKLYLKIDLKVN